jgi:recombination protein RecA
MTATATAETIDPKKESPKAAATEPEEVKPKKETKESKAAAAAKKGPSIASTLRALLKKHADLDVVKPTFSTMPHIPSGSIVLNNLIGGSRAADGKGQVCPGIPRRRILELYGNESCGKTTLALAAIVQCQKAGGVAMFIDMEHALHDGYSRAVGVDFDPEKLVYVKPDHLEQAFKAIYLALRAGADLVVVDSVAAMVPKDELEKNIDDVERVGSVALPLTRNLKKLAIWLDKYPDRKTEPHKLGTAVMFINQTRAKIGGGHGDEEQTPGGKALKFYSSIRLKMTKIKSEVIKKRNPTTGKEFSQPYGNVTIIKLVKTKIDSRQGQEGIIFIRYGSGLDDIYSIIESGVGSKIVKKDGAFFKYGEHQYQGREKFRAFLKDNPKVLAEFQAKVVEAMFASSVEIKPLEEANEEDQLAAEISADLGDDESFESEMEAEEEVVLSDEES